MRKLRCRECIIFKIVKLSKLYIMNILSKKCVFLLNVVVGCIIFIIVSSRFQDTSRTVFQVKKIVRSEIEVTPTILKTITNTEKLKIPWRFQIEEDGFVFPIEHKEEKFLTYDPVNSSWSDQLLQFENACVFAYLLKRTLIAPPLIPFIPHEKLPDKLSTDGERVPLFTILDSEVLSRKIKIKELDKIQVRRLSMMSKYYVCLDSRLGFWIDYIPSVENIQTWRLLRQQEFAPIDINTIKYDAKCPETVFGRWTYPKSTKIMYRGILTELTKIKEDVIYFYKDTLAGTYLRVFDKQRTSELQELLLLYIKFTPAIRSRLKILVNTLGNGYTAIDFNIFNKTDIDDEKMTYVENELQRIDANKLSKTIFVVSKSNHQVIFQRFQSLGYRVIFAKEFIKENINVLDRNLPEDKIHILALLLCAYAYNFIAADTTSEAYFIRHLRINDLFMANGIATESINVRWAKHTTREKILEFQRKKLDRTIKAYIVQNTTSYTNPANISTQLLGNLTSSNKKRKKSTVNIIKIRTKENKEGNNISASISKSIIKIDKLISMKSGKRTKDQLTSMVCLFCNYIRHITGQHGCPAMRDVC